jgi:prolyl-tRNA synthetase
MRQSNLFTKVAKDFPKEEVSINAQLLLRAGFVDKLMSGIYSYLPLGFLVLKKIEGIIRQEMAAVGGQEVFLPALHPKANWQLTGRWDCEEMLKVKNREGKDFGLGWTHEEIVTPLVRQFVSSYKDLPVYVYQIQDKFRDELRSKSGLLRGVEFRMKDLYSFHRDEKDLDEYYEKVKVAYFNIFRRCGLAKETYLTFASGGTFAEYSHEFQTETSAGEDTIYFCSKCQLGVNKEIIEKEKFACPQCGNKELEVKKTIEVGNIFKLKNRYSKSFHLTFKDEKGEEKEVLMGCYGIGLGRLMGTIAEIHHDDKGLIWPQEVAPLIVHLISLPGAEKQAEKIYQDLLAWGVDVLFDDRLDKSAGEKFAEADLIGLPLRLVVSQRTLEKDCLEVKKRAEQKVELIKIKDIKKCLK